MIRRSLPILAFAIGIVLPVAAQEDRDPGFLAGLIEDRLDAPGLNVEIDGFEGALSSRASIEELRISDDDGVWLRMTDVVLDWNRSALLRGRLEVEELSAALIEFERTPLPAEGVEPPPAAAQGFSLPDLPVSVAVERLNAERIELGAAVLGEAVALTLEASATLADGSGAANVQARRLDGPEGVFSLDASYDDEMQVLAIDLDAQEAANGIVATRFGIPDTPAIDLSVKGAGPLDDFAATIALASDGEPRVTGAVTLAGDAEGRRFDVDLGGDVTPLLAARYRPFFGDDLALEAQGVQLAVGGVVLDRLALRTEALTLQGRAAIGPDGWPELLDVEGTLAAADGGPVLLPIGGEITVERADLTLDYDPATSDQWTLAVDIADLSTPEADVGQARLSADGVLAREGGIARAAAGAIEGALEGMRFADPSVAAAVGSQVTLGADVDWEAGAPVRIADLRLEGAGYGLRGQVAVERVTDEDGTATVPATLDLAATLEDLAALAALTGLDLSGAAEARVSGTVAPLAGTFDLDVAARTTDLALGIAQVDPLLAGGTTLEVQARRTDQGTFLDGLELGNGQLEADASFAIYGEGTEARAAGRTGAAQVEARIFDGALIDPRLAGEVALTADVTQAEDGSWSGEVDLQAPDGASVSAQGQLTGGMPDVTFAARVPDLSAFVADVPGGLTLDGRAFARDGVWSLEADAEGPWGLTARVEGPVTGDAPRVAFTADLPRAAEAVAVLGDVPPLAGAVSLAGVASQAEGVWSVDVEARTEAGVVASVEGPVTGPAPRIAFSAQVPELSDFSPALTGIEALQGSAELTGTLSQTGEVWAVVTEVRTASGLVATVEGPVTGGAPRLAFDASVPDLSAFSDALDGIAPLETSARLSGTASQAAGAWSVEARAVTESGIEAEVAGAVTGDARRLGFDLRVPDLAAFSPVLEGVPPLRGPAAVTGTALQQDEGWTLDAALRTESGVTAEVSGPVTGPMPAVSFTLAVPDASALSPALEGVEPLQGPATLTGRAARSDGVWTVDVALDAEGGLSAEVSGPVTGDAARVAFSASIPDVAGLSPSIAEVDALRGPADLVGVAAKEDGIWRLDVTLDSEAGIEATVSGPLTGSDARVTFDARVPDLSAFSPALAEVEPLQGPAALSGVAAQEDGAWALDVDLSTDGGVTASIDGTVTGPAPRVAFSMRVPDVSAFSPALAEVEPLQGAASLTGVATQTDGAWAVDVALDTDGGGLGDGLGARDGAGRAHLLRGARTGRRGLLPGPGGDRAAPGPR